MTKLWLALVLYMKVEKMALPFHTNDMTEWQKTTAIPNTCRHLIANLLNEHCSPFDQVKSIALSLPQTHWKDF